jgi:hypothetical protein
MDCAQLREGKTIMKRISLGLLITALLANGAGNARELDKPQSRRAPQQRVWTQEPSSFLGVEFGKALAEQFEQCPKSISATLLLGKPCYEEKISPSSTQAQLYNPPKIGIYFEDYPYIYLVDGAPEQMSFEVAHYNWEKMLELLKAKYGEPTTATTEEYSTKGGMRLDGFFAAWQGTNITLMFSEYGSTIKKSSVTIQTSRLLDHFKSDKKRNAEQYKDRL